MDVYTKHAKRVFRNEAEISPAIQVFIGTKAQYIKTAPVLRLMDESGVAFRLIDSGQHAAFSQQLRSELKISDPDLLLGGIKDDVASIPDAIRWSLRLARRLSTPKKLRREVFSADAQVCIVHGDTPSTLLAALMARRAGLKLAHLEAGLRSHSLSDPFPEELIRIIVMRLSHALFAPDETSADNLRKLRVRGRIIPTSGNTVIDALRFSLQGAAVHPSGPVVATMHRVENLHRNSRLVGFVDFLMRVVEDRPVQLYLHAPTQKALDRAGQIQRLEAAGVSMSPLSSHASFTKALASAPFVITDGGSIQEECALLGVPTLLWRKASERGDGIGKNIVVGGYDQAVIARFLREHERLREPAFGSDASPSAEILSEIEAMTYPHPEA